MSLALYQRVALRRDLPEHDLRKGDVATLLDFVSHGMGGDSGCVVEVFNALGESIAVHTLSETDLEGLCADQVLAVRLRVQTA